MVTERQYVTPPKRRSTGRGRLRRKRQRFAPRRFVCQILAGLAVGVSGLLVTACGATHEPPSRGRTNNSAAQEPATKKQQELASLKRDEERLKGIEQPSSELPGQGAQLVQEFYVAQVTAWKAFFERKFSAPVRTVWRARPVRGGSTVTLEFRSESSGASSGTAEWLVSNASAEESARDVNPAELIHPQNARAGRFQGFPSPKAGRQFPVLLYALDVLTPAHRVVPVKFAVQRGYQPLMFVTAGGFDEAVLRGYGFAREVSLQEPPRSLSIPSSAAIYRAHIGGGRIGTLSPASFRALRESFGRGLVPVLVGWRHGAADLAGLLARPVQTLVILEP